MGAEEGGVEVWLGVAWERLGCGCGCGCGWGCGGRGAAVAVAGGVSGERLRASGVQMGLKPYVFTGGTEVLCFRRWEEV